MDYEQGTSSIVGTLDSDGFAPPFLYYRPIFVPPNRIERLLPNHRGNCHWTHTFLLTYQCEDRTRHNLPMRQTYIITFSFVTVYYLHHKDIERGGCVSFVHHVTWILVIFCRYVTTVDASLHTFWQVARILSYTRCPEFIFPSPQNVSLKTVYKYVSTFVVLFLIVSF